MSRLSNQVALCTVGTVLEWYDFSLFACLAPILSTIFFPKTSHFAALMSTFAIFASGFVMRPLGALFFGHLGDTLGRKYTLLITVFSMTIATTVIGLIPTGTTFATIALVMCRMVQGFATSGEYPGGLALLAEQNNAQHKSLISSMGIVGTGVGGVLGACVYALLLKTLSHEHMLQWGWRIPFLLGAPLGVLGYLLRSRIFESGEFERSRQQGLIHRAPLLQLFRHHLRPFFAALCITTLTNTVIYLNLMYFGNLKLSTHQLDAQSVMNLNLIVTLMYTLSTLFFGFLSDRVNKKILLLTGCGLLVVMIYPLFEVILGSDVHAQFVAQGLLSVLLGVILGPFASLGAENFPTEVRYSGLSLALNFSAAFFGGCAPMICGWLTLVTGSGLMPAVYLMGLAGLAFGVGLKLLREGEFIGMDSRLRGNDKLS